ncbi:MAG: hypothetical protein EXQ85_09840 [Alphaproteobacteria bacterium]|nr:hypothetical protein [Alphaproteobacteria bacterium]
MIARSDGARVVAQWGGVVIRTVRWWRIGPGVLIVLALFVGIALAEMTLARLPSSLVVQPGETPAGPPRNIVLREHRPNTRFAFVPPKIRAATGEPVQPFYPLETDRYGFINPSAGHRAPQATIVFLGGSTTEAMFVDPERRFPFLTGRLLEQSTGLRVNSLNGGRSGNNVVHAVQLLTGKVVPLKPTGVVLMENVNDLGTLSTFGTY